MSGISQWLLKSNSVGLFGLALLAGACDAGPPEGSATTTDLGDGALSVSTATDCGDAGPLDGNAASGDDSCIGGAIVAGIWLTVRDVLTGEVLCDVDVTVIDVLDEDFAQQLTVDETAKECAFAAAHEREGTYRISVNADGYHPAALELRVTRSLGPCPVLNGEWIEVFLFDAN